MVGQAGEVVASVAGLEFRSDLWPNLHHTLYAAAWDRRQRAGVRTRVLSGPLPGPLDATLGRAEAEVWSAAVDYYDRALASNDLLFGTGMRALNDALAAGRLDDPAVGAELRTALQAVRPVYTQHYWPTHDATNRDWIDDTVQRLGDLAPRVTPVLADWFAAPWPSTSPVPVDVVWVGGWSGAYTTLDPPHVTSASGDRRSTGWSAAEIMFHETAHLLIHDLAAELRRGLGDAADDHPDLWHVVLFYLTGQAVQDALVLADLDYQPYVYANGLLDGLWSAYRHPVESAWRPFVEGRCTRAEAIATTVAALRTKA